VSRFTFTRHAEADVDEIAGYLQGIPEAPALRIGGQIQRAIEAVVARPRLGRIDDSLRELSGFEIFRWVCGDYLIFYRMSPRGIEILGVLHGKRDIDTIMCERVG
jgi:plasmid stabilization system protein ParE